MKEFAECLNELSLNDPDLAKQFAGWHGLESVLQWMQERGFPPGSVDLIGMDEFEYDFLIELEPAGRWLVFGVT